MVATRCEDVFMQLQWSIMVNQMKVENQPAMCIDHQECSISKNMYGQSITDSTNLPKVIENASKIRIPNAKPLVQPQLS